MTKKTYIFQVELNEEDYKLLWEFDYFFQKNIKDMIRKDAECLRRHLGRSKYGY